VFVSGAPYLAVASDQLLALQVKVGSASGGRRLRKFISILLGLCLMVGGLGGFVYMFLYSGPVMLFVWGMPIGAFAVGLMILWEDVSSILKGGGNG
jgi:lipopolysaccharide export LptBFGC system permease protein LptF